MAGSAKAKSWEGRRGVAAAAVAASLLVLPTPAAAAAVQAVAQARVYSGISTKAVLAPPLAAGRLQGGLAFERRERVAPCPARSSAEPSARQCLEVTLVLQ